MSTAPQPQLSSDYKIRLPQKEKGQAIYVFYAANFIAPNVLFTNPAWALGGILRPSVFTLRHRLGYIRKCEITPLRPHPMSENVSQVHPDKREFMTAAYYVEENGEEKLRGVMVKDGQTVSNGLLTRFRYPEEEISVLTGQNDGIMRVPHIASDAGMRAAQNFLFPWWDQVLAGTRTLPAKLAEIQAHFEERKAAAQNAIELDLAMMAIESCKQIRNFGSKLIGEANAEYDRSRAKGWPWHYGASAELMFDQLDIPRRDMATQQQSDQMGKLTNAIAQLADFQLKAAGGGTLPPAAPAPAGDDVLAELARLRQEAEDLRRELAARGAGGGGGDSNKDAPAPVEFEPQDIVTLPDGRTGVIARKYAGAATGKFGVLIEGEDKPTTFDAAELKRAGQELTYTEEEALS